MAKLQAFDPYLDSAQLGPVARYIVDAPTLKAIHVINADPQRTLSFTMFVQPDYYFQTFSPCPGTSQGCVNDGFAWIHGDYSNDIGQSWLGIAGPGVNRGGIDRETWTDHTDIVPTMMHLLGLSTDYQPDGRVITQVLTPSAATRGIKGSDAKYLETERAIQRLASRRDALVQEMKDALDGHGRRNAPQLVRDGRQLLFAAEVLARS